MKDVLSALGMVLLALVASLAYAGLLQADEQIVYWGPVEQQAIEAEYQSSEAEPAPVACYWPPHSATWTFPGRTRDDLIRHLRGQNHGLSLEQLQAKSFAQLNAIHSSDHEGKLDRSRIKQAATIPKRTVVPSPRPSMIERPAARYCPSGNCPTFQRSTMRHRRGLFGRRRH